MFISMYHLRKAGDALDDEIPVLRNYAKGTKTNFSSISDVQRKNCKKNSKILLNAETLIQQKWIKVCAIEINSKEIDPNTKVNNFYIAFITCK